MWIHARKRLAGTICATTIAVLTLVPASSTMAQSAPGFEGTWSTTATLNDDPEWLTEDYYCFFGCTRAQITHFAALLDDPANDERSLRDLRAEAWDRGFADLLSISNEATRLDLEGRVRVDQLDEICLTYGHFGMAVSVMPLRITDEGDRLIFDYETHNTRRIVHMADSAPPPPQEPSRLGYSVAHYDDDALVIETSGVEAAPFFVSLSQGLRHSDELHTTERYTLSDGGRTLDMVFTVEDPNLFDEPWVWMKKWRLANHLELQDHGYDCSFSPGQR